MGLFFKWGLTWPRLALLLSRSCECLAILAFLAAFVRAFCRPIGFGSVAFFRDLEIVKTVYINGWEAVSQGRYRAVQPGASSTSTWLSLVWFGSKPVI